MTRFEIDNSTKDDGRDIQKMIKREAKKLRPEKKVIKKRSCFSCFNCFVIILVVIVGLLGIGSYLLAKTGLIDVPVMTALFYNDPEPIRIVEVNLDQKIDWEQKLLAAWDMTSTKVSLKITEEELTTVLATEVAKISADSDDLAMEKSQIVIDENQIEIFTKLTKPRNIFLTIFLQPVFNDDQWSLDVRKVKLGHIEVPQVFARLATKVMVDKLNQTLADLPIFIEDITLERQALIITGQININR